MRKPSITFIAGRQTELGDAAHDDRLIGGLLRVLAEHDDPARVERAVDVVMTAVHVERVLGERARATSRTIVEHLPGAW
mgnify:CR=1 FL=1